MHTTLRVAIGIVAGLIFLGGIFVIVSGDSVHGLWLLFVGGVGIVAVTLERNRYRSEQAERTTAPTGPGGGETDGALEGRFQRTSELFVDPSSGLRMRVWIDPGTGERRYRAEG